MYQPVPITLSLFVSRLLSLCLYNNYYKDCVFQRKVGGVRRVYFWWITHINKEINIRKYNINSGCLKENFRIIFPAQNLAEMVTAQNGT